MNPKKQIVEVADASYEKAETDLLKEALKPNSYRTLLYDDQTDEERNHVKTGTHYP